MKERTTQILLAIIAVLLLVHLIKPVSILPAAQAEAADKAPAVVRAQLFELVDKRGQVRAQLHLGEDGGGNLRLREASGEIRVKLGATTSGGGLLLTDGNTEPAIHALATNSGTMLKIAEKGKPERILKP